MDRLDLERGQQSLHDLSNAWYLSNRQVPNKVLCCRHSRVNLRRRKITIRRTIIASRSFARKNCPLGLLRSEQILASILLAAIPALAVSCVSLQASALNGKTRFAEEHTQRLPVAFLARVFRASCLVAPAACRSHPNRPRPD